MGRLLWPLALVITFLVGWSIGGVVRKGPSTVQEIERLKQQVTTLQARLRARDSLEAAGSSGTAGPAGAPAALAAGTARANSFATATEERLVAESLARSGAQPPGGRPADRGSSRSGAGTTPTVETALERFYRYLEATKGAEGRERWQRARELVDELRGMGDVAGQALMQVLASGSDSDERRAAARLLGALQVPEALPLLRDIIEKDDDLLLRRAAAGGLRQLQTPDSVPVMERLLADHGEDRLVRLSAAYGLAESGRSLGVAGLAQIFDEANGDGRGRQLAFRALASLNDERSLPFMRHLVTSQAEPSYRLEAIRYVVAQGDRQALAALRVVMQSSNEQPSVRDAAARAYAALSGK